MQYIRKAVSAQGTAFSIQEPGVPGRIYRGDPCVLFNSGPGLAWGWCEDLLADRLTWNRRASAGFWTMIQGEERSGSRGISKHRFTWLVLLSLLLPYFPRATSWRLFISVVPQHPTSY